MSALIFTYYLSTYVYVYRPITPPKQWSKCKYQLEKVNHREKNVSWQQLIQVPMSSSIIWS